MASVKEGWVCPRCGRALAPWMSECPCYRTRTIVTNRYIAVGGKCTRVCDNKTDMGYCRTTACIKPEYGGDEDYGRGNWA